MSDAPTPDDVAVATAAQPAPARWWAWVALIVILVAAAGLRGYRLDAKDLGTDELFSVHFAMGLGPWETALPPGRWLSPAPAVQSLDGAGPAWRIWAGLSRDTHPPLFFLLLRAWMEAFGDGDVAARLLSVVLALTVVVLLFDAGRVVGGVGAGLWAAAIAAAAAPQIRHAQEIRGYMLLAAGAALLLAVAVRILVRGGTWRRCAGFGAVSLGMMLTHYFAIGVIAPVAAVLLAGGDRATRRRLLASATVAAAVFAAAWGPFLLEQRRHFSANMDWIGDHEPGLAYRTLRRAAIVPLRLLFEPGKGLIDAAADGRSALWVAPLLLLVVPVTLGARRRATWLFASAAVGPVLLVALADVIEQRQTLNLIRYTLAAGPGLYLLLATAPGSAGRRVGWLIPGAALAACLAALPEAWVAAKPPWRAFVTSATAGLGSGDALVILRAPERPGAGAILYMAVSRYSSSMAFDVLILDAPAAPDSMDRLRGARTISVIADTPDPPWDTMLPGLPRPARETWVPEIGSRATIRTAPQ